METSIQFAGEPRSRKSVSGQGVGGVVPLRHRSLSRKRTHSIDVQDKIAELEDAEDEDAGLRDERDYKKKQVRKVCAILACSQQADARVAGVQREPNTPTGLPECRCHLW
jgi:KUP system potassium uptake protein